METTSKFSRFFVDEYGLERMGEKHNVIVLGVSVGVSLDMIGRQELTLYFNAEQSLLFLFFTAASVPAVYGLWCNHQRNII